MSAPKYDEDFKKSIVALYQAGKSQSQLSKEYGVSLSAVSRWVKQYSEVKLDDDSVISAQQIKELQKRNMKIPIVTMKEAVQLLSLIHI